VQHGTVSGNDEGFLLLETPLTADRTKMRIQVLGASGGIGNGGRTTSLRVDSDILIDAGTGVADLSLDELAAIDHVLLTHAHLDHVACIPFMVDSVGSRRANPLVVHGQSATLDTLRRHLFNDALWPDFTKIPSAEKPYLQYRLFEPGERVDISGRQFTSVAVTHSIPAMGYLVDSGKGAFAFSGDTTSTEDFWKLLNGCNRLRHVVIETSFIDAEESIARLSRHLSPRLLADELKKFHGSADIHITHLMPGEEQAIMDEIHQHVPDRKIDALRAGRLFEI